MTDPTDPTNEPEESLIQRALAGVNQFVEMAMNVRNYYLALVESGFSEQEALFLTTQWQNAVVAATAANHRRRDD